MRRNWKLVWAIATIGAILSVPAMAAEPFGSFGGIVGGGNAGSGVIPIHGWALHDVGVAAVDVYVDGVIAGRANPGKASPGVADLYPGIPTPRWRAGASASTPRSTPTMFTR